MFFYRYLHLCFAVLILFSVSTAHSALVTSLDITVNSQDYTVTFHDIPLGSFQSSWDANADGDFTNDGDVFDFEPTFWNDLSGAIAAANAIIIALSNTDWVDESVALSDGFFIPVAATNVNEFIIVNDDSRLGRDNVDQDITPLTNSLNPRFAWATFTLTPAPVPIPFTAILLLSGLVSLRMINLKKILYS